MRSGDTASTIRARMNIDYCRICWRRKLKPILNSRLLLSKLHLSPFVCKLCLLLYRIQFPIVSISAYDPFLFFPSFSRPEPDFCSGSSSLSIKSLKGDFHQLLSSVCGGLIVQLKLIVFIDCLITLATNDRKARQIRSRLKNDIRIGLGEEEKWKKKSRKYTYMCN